MVSDNILYLDFKKTSTKDFFVYTRTKSIAKYVIITYMKHHRQLIIDGMHLLFQMKLERRRNTDIDLQANRWAKKNYKQLVPPLNSCSLTRWFRKLLNNVCYQIKKGNGCQNVHIRSGRTNAQIAQLKRLIGPYQYNGNRWT